MTIITMIILNTVPITFPLPLPFAFPLTLPLPIQVVSQSLNIKPKPFCQCHTASSPILHQPCVKSKKPANKKNTLIHMGREHSREAITIQKTNPPKPTIIPSHASETGEGIDGRSMRKKLMAVPLAPVKSQLQ